MAMEVANIRKQFYETSLDYTMKLNDMNGLKRQEFLDSMLSMYFSEYEYYKEAWESSRAIHPTMLELKVLIS
jgi:hypothetical protein